MANILPHAVNLLAFGAGEPIKHLQGKPYQSWGNKTKAQLLAAATPETPRKLAFRRDQLARQGAASILEAGRGATLLTGQSGVSGQAEVSVPTLLGR